MITPEIPKNDTERLSALNSYNILDTEADTDFDDITNIASQICGTPISLVSLVDSDRQWFKSHHGLNVSETHRDFSFCAHAILSPTDIFEIQDSTKDQRFINNPLVVDDPRVIFYAGVPLVNPDGYALGTLCVIDNTPKKLDDFQKKALRALANQVIYMLELRKKVLSLREKQKELELVNAQLERFAQIASHDLKAPLVRIQAISDLFGELYYDKLDADGRKMVGFLTESSMQLIKLVEGILLYSKTTASIPNTRETFDLTALIYEIIGLIHIPDCFNIQFPQEHRFITTNRTAMMQILLNLCSNAVRYNDKQKGELRINFEESADHYKFEITDNGPGIAAEKVDKIFELFYTLDDRNRGINSGTGIGLATVKSLIGSLEGYISVKSVLTQYTTFEFTVKK